jgi:hypothetical protein
MIFKLYVDSRFRQDTGGASSDSEFSIELPHPIHVKGRAYVDVFMGANTYSTIRTGDNDKVFLREVVGATTTYRIVQIAEAQYNAMTLKDALLAALQAGRTMGGQYSVTYLIPENKLQIGNTDASATFHVYPTGWLKANASTWNAAAGAGKQIVASNLMDAGSVIGFATGTAILNGNQTTPLTGTDCVNTLPYSQLFLRSSLGNGYDAIGPDGSSDIVRRIVCQAGLNDVIIDQHSLPNDSVTVGDREISSLSFRLTDVYGKTVDSKGHHCSFSIIFLEDE